MTNQIHPTKRASATSLLAALAVAPFLFSSCGGLSKSDREMIDIPVGVRANPAVGDASTTANPEAEPTPGAPTVNPTPAAPPYSLADAIKYVVEPGDSLSAIATKYGASIGDVMTANKITNANKITIGQTLLLPAKETETETATETTSPVPSLAPAIPVEASDGIAPSGLTPPSVSGAE
ncbi:MAG: LysM repeat protein [Verrucomicrobiales bacterium]|jgi:LysM repeat protein